MKVVRNESPLGRILPNSKKSSCSRPFFPKAETAQRLPMLIYAESDATSDSEAQAQAPVIEETSIDELIPSMHLWISLYIP
jgi:hypothetical protein